MTGSDLFRLAVGQITGKQINLCGLLTRGAKTVVNETVSKGEAKATKGHKALDELSYRITVPNTTFDVERFSDALGPSVESNTGTWKSVRRMPRDPKLGYHLHTYWKVEDASKIRFQVDFHFWPPEWTAKHSTPFVEEFFDWTGQFFNCESVRAHVHAEFEFPVEHWQSKILALPISVPYRGKTAEIDGLSISFPSAPEGVGGVWLQRGKKHLAIELFGDRPLKFKGFTPYDDIDAFVSVLKSLIEERVHE